MLRTLSSALATEFAKSVTQPGYLVQIGLSTPLRLSNIGTVSWNSLTWTASDFTVDGIAFDADQPTSGRLSIQNLDGVIGALLLSASESMYDTAVTVYQFDRGALAADDVPKLAAMSIATLDVTIERVTLALVESQGSSQYSPRRRVSSGFGFEYATAPGSTFQWGNEIFTVGAADG